MVLDNQRLRELSEIGFTLTSSRQESRYPLFHYYFTDAAHQLSTISVSFLELDSLPKATNGPDLDREPSRREGARLDDWPPLSWGLNRINEYM